MYRHPEKVIELQEAISIKESELNVYKNQLSELRTQLLKEKELAPQGYEIIKPGEIVKDGAIGFEPFHGNWHSGGNTIGKIINDQGYVTGITHRGWIHANPLTTNH